MEEDQDYIFGKVKTLTKKRDSHCGRVVKISIKSLGNKIVLNEGYFEKDKGLKRDKHCGDVTILGEESISKLKKVAQNGICIKKFIQNITTKGIRLYEFPVGSKVKIGTSIHEIIKIGKSCYPNQCKLAMEEGICDLAKEVIFTKIVQSGKVIVGDKVEILE